jgi:hypothetical protein
MTRHPPRVLSELPSAVLYHYRNLRVPSDGGIDDACPAITATP